MKFIVWLFAIFMSGLAGYTYAEVFGMAGILYGVINGGFIGVSLHVLLPLFD